MNRSLSISSLCCVLLAITSCLFAAEPVTLKLWPDGVPGGLAKGEKAEIVIEQNPRIGQKVTKVTDPRLTVYKPKPSLDTGAAVVICPGGGYHILALDLEGVEIAKWLNTIGVTGIVLEYRVPRSKGMAKHERPLQDAQRALGLARQHAKEWNIDPQRIGLMGFSAGGHLTATAGTNFEKRTYANIDAADDVSCRPDFLMLVYPAYLTGEKKSDSVDLSDEIRVNANTPPTLLIHTHDDGVTSLSSIAFYTALKRNKVPAELHIYPSGGHGYGLRPTEHAVTTWPDRAARWLKSMKLLEKN